MATSNRSAAPRAPREARRRLAVRARALSGSRLARPRPSAAVSAWSVDRISSHFFLGGGGARACGLPRAFLSPFLLFAACPPCRNPWWRLCALPAPPHTPPPPLVPAGRVASPVVCTRALLSLPLATVGTCCTVCSDTLSVPVRGIFLGRACDGSAVAACQWCPHGPRYAWALGAGRLRRRWSHSST